MKAKKPSNTVKTEYRQPRLREKEQAIRELIEDKFNYPDAYPLQIIGNVTSADETQPPWSEMKNPKRANRIEIENGELDRLNMAVNQLGNILERLKRERRIYQFQPTSRVVWVWTTPKMWKTPHFGKRKPRFDKETNTIHYGQYEISLEPLDMHTVVCKEIFEYPIGTWINEDDLLLKCFSIESLDKDEVAPRRIRDIADRLSKKVESESGKEDFFEFEDRTESGFVRINV